MKECSLTCCQGLSSGRPTGTPPPADRGRQFALYCEHPGGTVGQLPCPIAGVLRFQVQLSGIFRLGAYFRILRSPAPVPLIPAVRLPGAFPATPRARLGGAETCREFPAPLHNRHCGPSGTPAISCPELPRPLLLTEAAFTRLFFPGGSTQLGRESNHVAGRQPPPPRGQGVSAVEA